MRFLANENVTGTVIRGLRQRGHDVLSVKESMRPERDDVILARAGRNSVSSSPTIRTSASWLSGRKCLLPAA